jgi:nucleoid DNA-binding protein
MRKSEIVRRVAEATDLTQVQAEKVVNATLDAMKSALDPTLTAASTFEQVTEKHSH